MNVNEYIASGIVELYAMNALSSEEKMEFERVMLLYPEIASELRKAEHALEELLLGKRFFVKGSTLTQPDVLNTIVTELN